MNAGRSQGSKFEVHALKKMSESPTAEAFRSQILTHFCASRASGLSSDAFRSQFLTHLITVRFSFILAFGSERAIPAIPRHNDNPFARSAVSGNTTTNPNPVVPGGVCRYIVVYRTCPRVKKAGLGFSPGAVRTDRIHL